MRLIYKDDNVNTIKVADKKIIDNNMCKIVMKGVI